MKTFLVLLVVSLISPSFGAQNLNPSPLQGPGEALDYSPFWDWKTLESEHFRVTYPIELRVQALKSIEYLEEAHLLMTPVLRWEPCNKVQIILLDNTDAANGLTSPNGRFGIVLYMTPPDSSFSTSQNDDWLRLLIIHEYAHYLNMDATRGALYNTLRILTGDVLLPNSIWPSWMLEGLAVYFETRFTQAGRGRSPYWEMILRTAVQDHLLDHPDFITLDKIQGTNPYFPGGETAYLFGYHLMNEISIVGEKLKSSPDGEQKINGADSVLGALSERSSWRIPFFLNGALENTIGKDWYWIWNKWVLDTQTRQNQSLTILKNQPLTPVKIEIPSPYSILGHSVSPDGNWIAYNQDSSEEPSGVYLLNLKTKITIKIADTLLSSGLTFSPDSRWIIYSSLGKIDKFYLFSDLWAYSLDTQEIFQLTHGLRLKDPQWVKTPTGDQIVVTQSSGDHLSLAISKIEFQGSKPEIVKLKKIFTPPMYDSVASPKFSANASEIIFVWKHNATLGENLYKIKLVNLVWSKPEALTQNQYRNRSPFFGPDSLIYYISDQSGVDNIYQLGSSIKTNVTSGIESPSLAPNHRIYFSYFTSKGWSLASIDQADLRSLDLRKIELPRDFAPKTQATSTQYSLSASKFKALSSQAHESDYSIFPSILPRQWLPLLFVYPNGIYIGGQILGFDAIDRHRYYISGAYDSKVQKGDIDVTYENRSLGPTFSLSGKSITSSLTVTSQGTLKNYTRTQALSLDAYYDFKNTFSIWTPMLGAGLSRSGSYIPNISSDPVAKSIFVPTLDAQLQFSNQRSSRLAVSSEKGRVTLLGSRAYLETGSNTFKYVFTDTEYIKVKDHLVIVPSIKIASASRVSNSYYPSNVVVNGTLKTVLTQNVNPLDEITIRGYPNELVLAQNVVYVASEIRFPLVRIFRGSGTNPIFYKNLSGMVFGESAIIPTKKYGTITFPAFGAGVRLDTQLLIHLPLNLALEYHHGLNRARGGRGQVYAGINLTAISF